MSTIAFVCTVCARLTTTSKDRRNIIFVALMLVVAAGNLSAQQSGKKPNIVIIMADDLDSKQLSCYGGKNIRTTNIDALAAHGLQAYIYASEAMCVPTRASLFTGLSRSPRFVSKP